MGAEHSLVVNLGITVLLYLALVFTGGLWGIAALYIYFAIEIALNGQGEGILAAGFLPLFMAPWAAVAVWVALKTLDQWVEVLTPGRER